MSFAYEPTDGPHDTLLIRWQRRHVGYINRPPSLAGRYRAYTIEGDIIADDHPSKRKESSAIMKGGPST